MARSGSSDVTIVSPLYETGVHNARIHCPTSPQTPDPLGYLDPKGSTAGVFQGGGGDDTNDWKPSWPDQTNVQGQRG